MDECGIMSDRKLGQEDRKYRYPLETRLLETFQHTVYYLKGGLSVQDLTVYLEPWARQNCFKVSADSLFNCTFLRAAV